MSSETHGSIKVRTTLPKQPILPNSERSAIRTARLVVRPFVQDDLEGYHQMRTQPEVMIFTMVGRIDKDVAETQSKLDCFLPPNDAQTYNFVLCLADTGEIIGAGGVHKMSPEMGWPEIGYMLKREHWGKGYATEFMKGFVKAWWGLEREEVEVEVDAESIGVAEKPGEVPVVPEMLLAIVDINNLGSSRILEKMGFKKFKTWNEPDSRINYEGKEVTLVAYVLEKNVGL